MDATADPAPSGEPAAFLDGSTNSAAEGEDSTIPLTPPVSPPGKPPKKKIWSKLALQRRKQLQDSQRRAAQKISQREERKKRLQKGWQSAKKVINKVNIGKWIDDLEKDQELADQLEQINEEHQAEAERRLLVAQVREECMDAIRTHLVSFLQETPEGSYEEWIYELHPDNISEHDNSIDARFYIEDSDHRILWNEHHQNTEDHAFGFSNFVPASTVAEATGISKEDQPESGDVSAPPRIQRI